MSTDSVVTLAAVCSYMCRLLVCVQVVNFLRQERLRYRERLVPSLLDDAPGPWALNERFLTLLPNLTNLRCVYFQRTTNTRSFVQVGVGGECAGPRSLLAPHEVAERHSHQHPSLPPPNCRSRQTRPSWRRPAAR